MFIGQRSQRRWSVRTDAGYVAIGERRETALKDAKDSVFRIAPQTQTATVDLQALVLASELTRPTAQRAIDELGRDGMLSRIGQGKRRGSVPVFHTGNAFLLNLSHRGAE
jgi:hypothetical protein